MRSKKYRIKRKSKIPEGFAVHLEDGSKHEFVDYQDVINQKQILDNLMVK